MVPAIGGGGTLLCKVHPVRTSSGGHRSGRYASYWNAFLLTCMFDINKFPKNVNDFPFIFIKYLLGFWGLV